jgi:hypothetical protein
VTGTSIYGWGGPLLGDERLADHWKASSRMVFR